MSYNVELKRLQPQPIAVVRRTARPEELSRVVPEACGAVWNFLRGAGIAGGRHVAVYLDDVMNVDIGAEVDGPFTGDGTVMYSNLPAGAVATTAHFGPYHLLGGAHDAIHRWCNERGLKMVCPYWEVYGHWTDDPAQLRTDVFYLLAG
jgi:effector-binding domain-containing protein